MNILKTAPPAIALFFVVVSSFAQKHSDSLYVFASEMPPAAISINPSGLHYSPHNGQKIDFGIITHNKWCYVVIKTKTPGNEKYVLSVDNTSIDSVLLFQLATDGIKQAAYTGGNLVPYNRDRKYVWHTIPLGGGEKETYILASFHDQGKNINVGYKIMTANNLDKLYAEFDRMIWFYLGVIFIILVAVLYGWFIFRNIALGYYTLYIAGVTGWILAHYGYLYPMLYPGFPALNGIAKPLAIFCGLIFLCLFLQALFKNILRQDKVSSMILKYAIRSGIVISTTLIFYFFWPKSLYVPALFNVAWHGYFIISFVCVLLVLVRLFERSVTARLFTLAIGIMAVMAIQQVLSNAGFFYNYLLNEHGMLLASIAEMMVLSFATFRDIWVDKKRISMQVAQLEEEHSRTLKQLVAVQDNERRRIAGELHDSIGPMLAAIKINFQRVAKAKSLNLLQDPLVEKTGAIIDGSMAEIRNISHQLMPKGLSAMGLAASLSEYTHNLREVYATPIDFKHNITAVLHKDVQLNVYRIMSELLLNAAKHSKASCITAFLETTGGNMTVLVQDDGQGFDPAQVSDASFGLKNIESRVKYLKGTMQTISAPGEGARIMIIIPQGGSGGE
ncbi:MAG: hypothetical protein KF746_02140 [Chitinophagaceae bacterium]|nr:hypothetical protein [Chitinophagaceae bacterium]